MKCGEEQRNQERLLMKSDIIGNPKSFMSEIQRYICTFQQLKAVPQISDSPSWQICDEKLIWLYLFMCFTT